MKGTIVKLDRGYPLVETEAGSLVRCEHATSLVKGERVRAVIGDHVEIELPEGHDCGIVRSIGERRTQLVRKDPTERTVPQVLAANFDLVILAEPIVQLNRKRLERALVLAHETGADVAVVLTKADLADD
ncbi:MAG: GTPase RsgA, partial [Eggerthellaceae bacterium]|nr:GTPase RsgA [Eggerthellaceae bacterium]